jgi:hypothetical protein
MRTQAMSAARRLIQISGREDRPNGEVKSGEDPAHDSGERTCPRCLVGVGIVVCAEGC